MLDTFIYIKGNIFANIVTHNMQLYVHFEESSGNMRYRRRLHRRDLKRQRIIIASLFIVLLCFFSGMRHLVLI